MVFFTKSRFTMIILNSIDSYKIFKNSLVINDSYIIHKTNYLYPTMTLTHISKLFYLRLNL